jgi:WD40 repeat protein/serine/threonine protein kinase
VSAPEIERELLFCLQALQLGLVDRGVLQEAGRAWDPSAAGLRLQVLKRAALGEADLALLDRNVELLVKAHGGDVHAAAEAMGGARVIAESLADVLRVEGTLPRASEPTLHRPESAALHAADDDSSPVTPEAPGRYEIRGELGRGGIGRVLVGFDDHVGREVALKELLVGAEGPGGSASDTQTASARFLREARLTAQLEHPSIVPVYEVGRRPDGTLYYSMRVVRGRTLAVALRSCTDVAGRLRFLHHFGDLCAAVAFAHSRGVLHRDLKPHNVMIGEFNETVLLDWGLAKIKGSAEREDRRFARQMEVLRDAAAGETVEGAALGTPEYMPPEQAFGDLERVDEHSDVYSLGAVLYELLTGKPPFGGRHGVEALLKVQRYGEGKEELVRVRKLEPEAPPELAAVAEKALFPQTHGRYRSAKELLEEINAYMEGRRVSAYAYSKVELARRFVRRNKAVSALATVLVVAGIAFLAALTAAWRQATEAERRVHWDMSEAYAEKAARLAAEHDFLGARVYAAAALRDSRYNPLGSFADPRAALSREGDPAMASLQSTLWTARQLGMARHRATLSGHSAAVESVRFSPDGTRLATVGLDRTVRVWSVADGREVAQRPAAGMAMAVAWSPDGKTLAHGDGKAVRLWRPDGTAEPVALGGHADTVTALAFAPDGKLLASASRDRTVRLWATGSGESVAVLTPPEDVESYPERIAFSADGGRLVAAGLGEDVLVWDVAHRRVAERLRGHEGGVASLVVSPTGAVWILGNDRTVKFWDPSIRDEDTLISLGDGQPRGLAVRFGGGGEALLAVGRGEVVELWDAGAAEKAAVLRGHEGQIRSVTFSPDGKLLASAGVDQRINLWEIAERPRLAHLPGHRATLTTLAPSPDGRLLLTGGRDRSLRLWDLEQRRSAGAWQAHEAEVVFAAFAPDGTALSVARDGVARHWSPDGQQLLGGWQSSDPGAGATMCAALSPDGRQLATAGLDGAVRLWSPADGAKLGTLPGNAGGVGALAYSPDGKTLATGGRDKAVRLWDLATLAERRVLTLSDRARALAFSPDGKLLAVGSQRMVVELYDGATFELRATLAGHHDAPRALSFSKDGTRLATGGASDSTVRLWEVPSGRLLQVVDLADEVRAVGLLGARGETLAAGDGLLLTLSPLAPDLWRSDPSAMLDEAQREAGMRLDRFALTPLSAPAAR